MSCVSLITRRCALPKRNTVTLPIWGEPSRKGRRPTFCSGPTFCNRPQLRARRGRISAGVSRNTARHFPQCGPPFPATFWRIAVPHFGPRFGAALRAGLRRAFRAAFRLGVAGAFSGRNAGPISRKPVRNAVHISGWLGGSAATGPQKERRCALPRPRPRKSKRAVPAYSARRATLLRRPFEPRAPPACIPRGRCADVSLPDRLRLRLR